MGRTTGLHRVNPDATIHTQTFLLNGEVIIVEFIGLLILVGIPLAGYNMFVKNDQLALLTADEIEAKKKLRSKIFKTSFYICLGSTFVFHLILATFGEAVLMWAVITMPIVFVFNALFLLLIMEIVNRRKI